MSIFKRLSATLVSRIDQVVGEIENHDAVVQASVDEMRRKVAESKVRLGQLHREQERLEKQIREQQDKAQRWRQRAVETAKTDETKALECVSRSRHCRGQAEQLQQALLQYQRTAEKLAADIQTAEHRLTEVKQKLTLMRARQSTNAARHATRQYNEDAAELLDDTFDRWEINITAAELGAGSEPVVDPIEREFVQREHEDELRRELDTLLAGEDHK